MHTTPAHTPTRAPSTRRHAHNLPHPPRRLRPLPQCPRIVHSPPPRMTGDGAGDADGCGLRTANDEVDEDDDVGVVDEWEGEDAVEGGLGASG